MVKMRKIAMSAAISLVLAFGFGSTGAYAAPSVTRIDGGAGGRIGTADELAKQQFSSASNVILVNGYNYADAVSATPLAKQLEAPILLTAGSDELESEVADTIKDLGAKNIYIIGGTGVVSVSIEISLKTQYKVERIEGTGDTTRMGTNAAVAKKVLSMSNQKTGMLVYGYNYPDALSVAAIAAQKGYPVLFSGDTDVSPVIKEVASGLTIKAVGGDGVLPASVVNSVKGTKITGNTKDRYETNLAVLDYFDNNGGIDFDTIYVAFGGSTQLQFADALSASAAAAKDGSPLVLSGSAVNDPTIKARNYILSKKESPKIIMVGGTGVINSQVESYFKNDDPFGVIGIE
ncbi:MAG: cell wall-binding repeat-containing protein [Clostridium sp.]|jgi:putative cell wall-binding protein|uniref:cell wall-binding repeat-containing protein n=1 Tax=Clostridium sp. TaxID=1506 RepID=UPI0025C1F6C7|nr:cell wall-binding repeat-containing protein [Clostridium sp.]MCH3965057.1 cell wall-binding repeat-containing protein [Clostridium sp.]MCI1714278.1 cell wall-binding repeat-containing protein [Clostridium sp.]MCI1798540.1 cell wall-binding repeat-containing protein [Clostridium sp.]MCI1812729.1 cell wall-binding repeat-containing protein [Clostridium sp.]MCI1869349.1 cell wall-binding repeat-containing protein [Clostridium sp.]